MSITVKEITDVIGFIVASGVISIVLTWLVNKKKNKVEIKKLIQETESSQVQAAANLLSMGQSLIKDISAERIALSLENDKLEKNNEELTLKIQNFQKQVDSLEKQVDTLNHENLYLKSLVEKAQVENKLLQEEVKKLKQS